MQEFGKLKYTELSEGKNDEYRDEEQISLKSDLKEIFEAGKK